MEPETKKTANNSTVSEKPVFKIQILTSGKVLSAKNRAFKGLSPVSYYKENGLIKYTYGADTNYNSILKLKRNNVDSKFKDAFIIALKNGKKINVNQAIKIFKKHK